MTGQDGETSLSQLKRFAGLDADVLEVLKEAILDGLFGPGDRLNESRIADQLNISRGPIREALRRLEEMGLVARTPGKGCFVKQFDRKEIEELWTLRAVLEEFAIEIACTTAEGTDLCHLSEIVEEMHLAAKENEKQKLLQLDLDFHDYLLNLANHSLLKRTWEGLGVRIQRFLNLQPGLYEDLDNIAQTHEPILSALRDGDVSAARQAVRQHIHEVADLSTK